MIQVSGWNQRKLVLVSPGWIGVLPGFFRGLLAASEFIINNQYSKAIDFL